MGGLIGNTFTGARTVTTLLVGLFLWAVYRIGRVAFGTGVAVAALLATMLNYFVVTLGIVASTDIPGTAFTLAALALALAAWTQPSTRATLKVAAAFALSFFTRYTALGVLPTALCAVAAPGRQRRSAVRRAVVFCGAVALFLVPHFVLNTAVFGHPLHQENLRTTLAKTRSLEARSGAEVSTKYYEAKGTMPYGEVKLQLLENPGQLVRGTLWAIGKLPKQLMVLHGPAPRWFRQLLFAFWMAGFVHGLFSADARHRLLLSFVAVHTLMVCIFGFGWPRLMLPLLPLGFLFAFRLLERVLHRSPGLSRLAAPVLATVAGVLAVGIGTQTALQLPSFAKEHPWGARQLALRLQEAHGTQITVLTDVPSLRFSVDYEMREIWSPGGPIEDLDAFVCAGLALKAGVEPAVRRQADGIAVGRFDYVILGRELGSTPRPCQECDSLVGPVDSNEHASLYRVTLEDSFDRVTDPEDLIGVWSGYLGDSVRFAAGADGSVAGRWNPPFASAPLDVHVADALLTTASVTPSCSADGPVWKMLRQSRGSRPCLLLVPIETGCIAYGWVRAAS